MSRKKAKEVSLVHIDEYLALKDDLRPEVKAGFRVFMEGKGYQYGMEAFDSELENYFKRKLNGGA